MNKRNIASCSSGICPSVSGRDTSEDSSKKRGFVPPQVVSLRDQFLPIHHPVTSGPSSSRDGRRVLGSPRRRASRSRLLQRQCSPALSPLVPRGEWERARRRNDALDQAVQITRRDFLATSASGLGTLEVDESAPSHMILTGECGSPGAAKGIFRHAVSSLFPNARSWPT
jgi:hypothetical protein